MKEGQLLEMIQELNQMHERQVKVNTDLHETIKDLAKRVSVLEMQVQET